MSKFKTMIRKDIEICNKYIEENFAKHSEVQTLVGKYLIDYPDFNKGLIEYVSVPGCINNEISNIKIVKGKLEYLLNRGDNPELYNNKRNTEINVTTVNNNANNNANNNLVINIMSANNIKKNIEDNTYLSDSEKNELLKKLDEIVELSKSTESKARKWNKARNLFTFLLDKGADIAIMYILQIISAISK